MADEQYAEAGKGTTLKSVEVFSAGTWSGSRKVTVTPAMLDGMVKNFATLNQISGFGVPIKLGHNKTVGEPAYGWMSALERIGDTLVADFADVDPAIVDAISKRRYNSVSVELWPAVEYAGKVFENVLSGVALLGAEWPAVKGLKPLSASVFAEAGDKIELSTKEPDMTFTEDQHATLMAAAVTKAIAETEAKTATALSEATAKVTAAEAATAVAVAAKDAAEKTVKDFAEKAEKAEIAEIITAAEKKGQIVPANKAAIEAFAEKVRLSATGEDRKALLASFKGFVEAMPAKVKFGEQGSSEATALAEGETAVSKIDALVKAHMSATKTTDYAVAFAAVLADPANAELKTAYAQEM